MCKSSVGHMNTTIITPVVGVTEQYTIIIRFDTRQNLLAWMESDARKALIQKARPLLVDDDKFVVSSGLDFWFTPEGVKAKLPRRWKQFLITWSAIYPLVIFVPMGFAPLFHQTPIGDMQLLKTLIVSGAIVALMVYVVMPNYTRLVQRWLYS